MDFNGTVNFTVAALSQEELGDAADFCTTARTFTLAVTPVPEPVESLLVTSYSANSVQLSGTSGVSEAGPETITAILNNVREGAFVRNASGIAARRLNSTN